VIVAAILVTGAALVAARFDARPASLGASERIAQKQLQFESQGTENGGAGGEAAEFATASQQFIEARTAPGIVAPGAYSAAFAELTGLSAAGGSWSDVTKVPYDADDPDYRDYYSNSSGGSGLVTGRITGLAADGSGHVYAAAADGGVWRSSTGGGNWTPIADSLPTLSSGDLQLASDGSLWYASGEANTGGTSFVGSGVYRLANPATGTFSPADRVGGTELESTTINSIRFTGTKVWVATLRGVWSHALGNYPAPWTLSFAPNPAYLPASVAQYAQDQSTAAQYGTGSTSSETNAPYKNIANDVAIDPKNPKHILAAIGWRSGDTYNGFYETTNDGASWTKINPTGGLDATDIGNVSFAFSKQGDTLYAINQSPRKLNSLGAQNTYLDGVYVSKTGSLTGPWNKIASSDKLSSHGSALKGVFGQGYSPGIQSWYNQLIIVDPANANHVYVGLEEVYETTDGGSNWTTVGPYWNFYFSCWAPDALYPPDGGPNRCPQTTHPDQHSIAVGSYQGKQYVFVGNDGGIYRRPLNGQVNGNGNGTDWQSLNDGSIDALQFYAVGIGKVAGADGSRPDLTSGDGVLVSGGLQDNGGSLLRPGAAKMVSNFGGDGGDVLVDPNDGCNIVQEYVFLSMSVTQTCANPGPDHPNAFLDLSQSTTFKVGPPDINARFIAPFAADAENIDNWVAGGNSLWLQSKGFAIRSGSEWTKAYTFGGGAAPARVATALAYSGSKIVAGWCGQCNNNGFTRGLVIGTKNAQGAWTWTQTVPPYQGGGAAATQLPNRYIGGVAVDPSNSNHLVVVMNGFNRRFTEGPGADVGHVFESTDGGTTWTNADGNFPDVPSSSVKVLGDGSLVVGTDLGMVYRAAGSTTWQRLGTNFPVTVVLDVELGPDNNIYAATHGRGIWRIASPAPAAAAKRR
jgi:hypothetical protein